jgi:hypothetical protein
VGKEAFQNPFLKLAKIRRRREKSPNFDNHFFDMITYVPLKKSKLQFFQESALEFTAFYPKKIV